MRLSEGKRKGGGAASLGELVGVLLGEADEAGAGALHGRAELAGDERRRGRGVGGGGGGGGLGRGEAALPEGAEGGAEGVRDAAGGESSVRLEGRAEEVRDEGVEAREDLRGGGGRDWGGRGVRDGRR